MARSALLSERGDTLCFRRYSTPFTPLAQEKRCGAKRTLFLDKSDIDNPFLQIYNHNLV